MHFTIIGVQIELEIETNPRWDKVKVQHYKNDEDYEKWEITIPIKMAKRRIEKSIIPNVKEVYLTDDITIRKGQEKNWCILITNTPI